MIDDQPTPAPDLVAYLSRQPARQPMRQRPIADARTDLREWAISVGGEPEPVGGVEPLSAGGVPARLYSPRGSERGVLVWLHGGAWLLGDLESCDRIARVLANRAGVAVVCADYRLAPEHPFPAAIDDAWAVTSWAYETFDTVAVGGDSAGGNLAAAVALRSRDGGMALALQLLIYPIVEYAVETASYYRFGYAYAEFAGREGFGPASHDDLRYMWDLYVPDPAQRLQRDCSPMRAASLGGLAPALIVTAEHDILRMDGHQYARWLQAEGVPVELHDYTGQIHGFFHMLGVTDAAHDAIAKAAAALRRAFERSETALLR